MPNIVNFDEVKERNYITVAGTYTVKVMSVERKPSNQGIDMDVYQLETQDGQSIRLFLSLSEKARFKYKAFIRAVNKIPDTDKVGTVDIDSFSKQAVGKKLVIVVALETRERRNIETGDEETVEYTKIIETKAL